MLDRLKLVTTVHRFVVKGTGRKCQRNTRSFLNGNEPKPFCGVILASSPSLKPAANWRTQETGVYGLNIGQTPLRQLLYCIVLLSVKLSASLSPRNGIAVKPMNVLYSILVQLQASYCSKASRACFFFLEITQ